MKCKHFWFSVTEEYVTNNDIKIFDVLTRYKTIKKWANDGYTVFCIAVYPHCFDGIAGK